MVKTTHNKTMKNRKIPMPTMVLYGHNHAYLKITSKNRKQHSKYYGHRWSYHINHIQNNTKTTFIKFQSLCQRLTGFFRQGTWDTLPHIILHDGSLSWTVFHCTYHAHQLMIKNDLLWYIKHQFFEMSKDMINKMIWNIDSFYTIPYTTVTP